MKGDRKWEIAEITIGIFFVFGWDLYSLFFIQGVFKSHLKKHHPHLQCQFPPKIPIWPKSLLYERSEKWLSHHHPPPATHHPGGRVWTMSYIFFVYFCLLRKTIWIPRLYLMPRKSFGWCPSQNMIHYFLQRKTKNNRLPFINTAITSLTYINVPYK